MSKSKNINLDPGGTPAMVRLAHSVGAFPYRYWSREPADSIENISGEPTPPASAAMYLLGLMEPEDIFEAASI